MLSLENVEVKSEVVGWHTNDPNFTFQKWKEIFLTSKSRKKWLLRDSLVATPIPPLVVSTFMNTRCVSPYRYQPTRCESFLPNHFDNG